MHTSSREVMVQIKACKKSNQCSTQSKYALLVVHVRAFKLPGGPQGNRMGCYCIATLGLTAMSQKSKIYLAWLVVGRSCSEELGDDVIGQWGALVHCPPMIVELHAFVVHERCLVRIPVRQMGAGGNVGSLLGHMRVQVARSAVLNGSIHCSLRAKVSWRLAQAGASPRPSKTTLSAYPQNPKPLN